MINNMINLGDARLLEYLQTIPGLDVPKGLANLSNNIHQFHELIVQVDERYWCDITRLEQALKNGEETQVLRQIHDFKSATGTLGLTTLQNCAVTLESHLRGNGSRADKETLKLAGTLRTEMDRFHHALLRRKTS
ncbi:MAG: Hpt domain-containing protein [Xanthomonadales bacterium]|nr:Hpt domain-containing protein [Xanthomonadales bacterium]